MIQSSKFVISSPDVTQCPPSSIPEYAFIGRSNVGKSSLINMICHNPHLAKTSQKPGKTLLINHFLINEGSDMHWHLVDLPGYGYAQAGQSQRVHLREMIERYCQYREALVSLFILIDCRHEAQEIDLQFMQWVGENEIPFAIVFTKADKIGKQHVQTNLDAYKERLLEQWEELPPIFVTSAQTGQGGDALTAYIESINRELLNRS